MLFNKFKIFNVSAVLDFEKWKIKSIFAFLVRSVKVSQHPLIIYAYATPLTPLSVVTIIDHEYPPGKVKIISLI